MALIRLRSMYLPTAVFIVFALAASRVGATGHGHLANRPRAAAHRAAASKPGPLLSPGYFLNPPNSAKPQTWWHWVNGNITGRGITADLEAMKRVGIGGAEIFNVDVGIPPGPAPFMSPQWKRLVHFAISEAHRLHLQLEVHNGAGWSSSGGPWITPQYAMQKLVWTALPISGPVQFAGKLAEPQVTDGYYRDIAVFAFKTPPNELDAGGTKLRISDISEKACFNRGGRILPQITPTPPGAAVERESIRNISASMTADGTLTWNVPAGNWTILRMGSTPTGAENEPAPPSGRGLEVDKLSRTAFDHHWAGMMATVLNQAGPLAGSTLRGALIDSYEVGSQNWTPNFRRDFMNLRGYDPLPWLPVVTGRVIGSVAKSERFLWDFRRTIADLYANNYYGYFAHKLHQRGMIASAEPYGNAPFDEMQSGGTLDIPMGEFWVGGAAIETLKLASSIGHTYGRPVVGAESFTADEQHARWTRDPYSLKALGDLAFCLGINRFIFHRYAMQPWLHVVPGMTMGPWGTNFDRTVTWWNQGAAWMKYLARCQYLLQAGHFVADVLSFEGEDGPNTLSTRSDIRPAIPDGYDFDGVDTRMLMKLEVRNGRLWLPDGMSYRVLGLPDGPFMTPQVARKIRDLVRNGATVVGPRPVQSPSLAGYPQCDAEVRQIAQQVWGGCNGASVTEHAFGKGRAVWGRPLTTVFHELHTGPDFTWSGPADLAFIHRDIGGAQVYFVSNQRYVPVTPVCSFRVAGLIPEFWHPATGKIQAAPVYRASAGRTTVPIRLDPAGSIFVVFRKPSSGASHFVSMTLTSAGRKAPPPPSIRIISARYSAQDGTQGADVTAKVAALVAHGVTDIAASNQNFGDPAPEHVKQLHVQYLRNGKGMEQTVAENEVIRLVNATGPPPLPAYQISGGRLIPWQAGIYRAISSSGRVRTTAVKHPAEALTITGPWKLRFPPHLGAPPAVTLPRLISWPNDPIPGVRYFSGTAVYSRQIRVPARLLRPGRVVVLDLGTVKNLAQLRINGHDLGVLWKAPFRLDVSGLLHPGLNALTIRVTNLWPNRMIGDDQLPDDVQWSGTGLAKWPAWLLQHKPRPQQGRITFAPFQFFSKNSPLLPSGLIGPVVIRSAMAISLGRAPAR